MTSLRARRRARRPWSRLGIVLPRLRGMDLARESVSTVSLVNAWVPTIDLRSTLVASAASTAAGLLAGLLPASRAVRIAPVQALQR